MEIALLFALLGVALSGAAGRPDGGGYTYAEPVHSQQPIIQKHIYVHVPPPDPEFHAQPQRVVPAPPPKKHYKIVFIKAPTYSPPPAPVIPELQQNQEKTLIYVLHKNPQDAPPIVIPSAKPTQPTKPEVYFIRYKTQKEVGYAGGQEGGHQQQVVVTPSPISIGGGHGGFGGGHGGGGGFGGLTLGGGGHDSGYSPSQPSSTAVYGSSTPSGPQQLHISSPRPHFIRVRSPRPTPTKHYATPSPSTVASNEES